MRSRPLWKLPNDGLAAELPRAATCSPSATFLVDRTLLGSPSGLFDENAQFGAADAIAWTWFLWNLTYLVGRTGQSWGRKLIGLRVVGAEGLPIGFWRALGRNVFAGLISAIFYLGFLWVIWDDKKQAWHDKVFRTFVIRKAS